MDEQRLTEIEGRVRSWWKKVEDGEATHEDGYDRAESFAETIMSLIAEIRRLQDKPREMVS